MTLANRSRLEYSFVVAIYNDAYLADDFCKTFEETFKKYLQVQNIVDDVELIFVNDGSTDNSFEQLKELPPRYPFVRIIDLSRNFGQHLALACGFKRSLGRYVGRLNVDMQDPPDQIPKLLEVIKSENVDLVVGRYEVRHSHLFDRMTAHLFFAFFNWLTGQKTPQNTSPLRVMNRRFIDAYNQLQEKTRFPQGLENWLGFKHHYVLISHQDRKDGKSSYTFGKRLKLAVEGAIAFSDRPLKLAIYLGFFIILLGCLLAAYVVAQKIIFNTMLTGYTSVVSLIILCAGLQIFIVGVAGLYVGKILMEVQNRPPYIIRERINFEN